MYLINRLVGYKEKYLFYLNRMDNDILIELIPEQKSEGYSDVRRPRSQK
jgi:hypothetical protein